MKKKVIGSIVGGVLIFIWQTLSWTVLNLHNNAQQYTPKQDSILHYLGAQLPEQGGYLLPNAAPGTSMAEMQKQSAAMTGKPWAQVFYHSSYQVNMGLNMAKGLVADIIMVWLFCWIVLKLHMPRFSAILTAAVCTGLIVFLNEPFTTTIWYPMFDIKAHLLDALVSWALAGIWLGWYLRRR